MKKFLITFVVSLALLVVMTLGLQAQGGVTTFASMKLQNYLRLQPRTAITISMNGWLTATGSYQQITAAGTVATSGARIAVKPSGTVLTLVNTANQSITFTETGTLKSAGNLVLGQYDAVTLYSDGTNWVEVSASNN